MQPRPLERHRAELMAAPLWPGWRPWGFWRFDVGLEPALGRRFVWPAGIVSEQHMVYQHHADAAERAQIKGRMAQGGTGGREPVRPRSCRVSGHPLARAPRICRAVSLRGRSRRLRPSGGHDPDAFAEGRPEPGRGHHDRHRGSGAAAGLAAVLFEYASDHLGVRWQEAIGEARDYLLTDLSGRPMEGGLGHTPRRDGSPCRCAQLPYHQH